MIKKGTNNVHKKDFFYDLQDYMFTSKNINRYTKHIIHFNNENITPKSSLKNIEYNVKETIVKETNKNKEIKNHNQTIKVKLKVKVKLKLFKQL